MKKHPILWLSIPAAIALFIGVVHKKPEWYQTYRSARWERKETKSVNYLNRGPRHNNYSLTH